MKRIFATLLIFSAIFTAANAQKINGSFSSLREEARVQMNIDFSEADIMGMSEAEFADYEKDWTHDKVQILNLFYENVNDALNGAIVVGNYKQGTDYMLDLVVRTVNPLPEPGRRLPGVCRRGPGHQCPRRQDRHQAEPDEGRRQAHRQGAGQVPSPGCEENRAQPVILLTFQ